MSFAPKFESIMCHAAHYCHKTSLFIYLLFIFFVKAKTTNSGFSILERLQYDLKIES